MIKVLVLSKYGKQAASARHRFFQFQPFMAEQGIDFNISPLFDDAYLQEKFSSGRSNPWLVITAFVRRLFTTLTIRQYDLVIVHCELMPYFPALLERLLLSGRPHIYDYDDAIFHMYDQHKSWLVRHLLGKKIASLVVGAKAVVAGSQYLANYANGYSNIVNVVPTVIDLNRYLSTEKSRQKQPFTVGWTGSPSTSVYLEDIVEPLKRVAHRGELQLIVVGAAKFSIDGVKFDLRPWSHEREVEDILDCDVGIMPLPDQPWARGKCGFKLIQYMACGLPVVASPVGMNSDIVEHGVNGFLASTDDEWTHALDTLRADPALRQRMGAAGRRKVEDKYCLQVMAPKLAGILKSAAVKS